MCTPNVSAQENHLWEFSEFVQEKKVHILHSFSTLHKSNKKGPEPPSESHRSKGISDLVLQLRKKETTKSGNMICMTRTPLRFHTESDPKKKLYLHIIGQYQSYCLILLPLCYKIIYIYTYLLPTNYLHTYQLATYLLPIQSSEQQGVKDLNGS